MNIKLSSDSRYADAEVYALYGDSTEIHRLDDISKIKDNSISIDIKPLSVTEIVIRSDKKSDVPVIAVCAAALIAVGAGVCIALKKRGK